MKLEIKIDPVTKEQMVSLESLNLHMMKLAEKAINDAASPYLTKARDTTAAVNNLMQGFGGEVEKLVALKGDLITALRDARFATTREVKEITAGVNDLVSIIDGKKSEQVLASLQEFADVCERLQKLRTAGIFDSVLEMLVKTSDTTDV
jgi:hypothetical protein